MAKVSLEVLISYNTLFGIKFSRIKIICVKIFTETILVIDKHWKQMKGPGAVYWGDSVNSAIFTCLLYTSKSDFKLFLGKAYKNVKKCLCDVKWRKQHTTMKKISRAKKKYEKKTILRVCFLLINLTCFPLVWLYTIWICQRRGDQEGEVSVARCPFGRTHKGPTWE